MASKYKYAIKSVQENDGFSVTILVEYNEDQGWQWEENENMQVSVPVAEAARDLANLLINQDREFFDREA